MIVIPSQKLVIVTPSRTASRAVHLAICTDCRLDAIWVDGPVGWGVISHDHRHIPMWFSEFSISMVIRNPFDRLVSLWRHIAEHQPALHDGDQTFAEYVRRVRFADDDYYGPFRWTLHQWCEGMDLSSVIRFESIASDLEKLVGVAVDVPVVGATNRNEWYKYYVDDTLSLATEWARNDLERWYPSV